MGDAWNDVLARLFDGSVNLALHDAKDIIKNLLLRGLDPRGITFDTALAAYLIDPAQSSYDLPRTAMPSCRSWIWTIRRRFRRSADARRPAALRRSISPRCARSSAR